MKRGGGGGANVLTSSRLTKRVSFHQNQLQQQQSILSSSRLSTTSASSDNDDDDDNGDEHKERSILAALSTLFREEDSRISDESVEDSILAAVSTLFQDDDPVLQDFDEQEQQQQTSPTTPSRNNRIIARILPRSRLDYEQRMPNERRCDAKETAMLLSKAASVVTTTTSSSSLDYNAAMCRPNRTIQTVSYFDFAPLPNCCCCNPNDSDNDDNDDKEEHSCNKQAMVVLDTDVMVPSQTSPSIRYHIQMHLHRSAQESAARSLDRIKISLKRKLWKQERYFLENHSSLSSSIHTGGGGGGGGTCTPPVKNSFKKLKGMRQEDEPVSLWVKREKDNNHNALVVDHTYRRLQTDDDDDDSINFNSDDEDEDGYSEMAISKYLNGATLWRILSSKSILQSQLRMDLSDCSNHVAAVTTTSNTEVVIPIVACPPTLISVQTFLDFHAKVFVGVPLVVQVEALHVDGIAVFWFVDGEKVHSGSLVYTPRAADVGKHVSILLVPTRLDHAGSGFEEAYMFQNPVENLPSMPLIHPLRVTWTQRDQNDRRLRVLSYNLLADFYASREVDQQCNYKHCPEEFLEKGRRFPLLLYEMLMLQPDVICLQEVDASIYRAVLKPVLESQGYQGFYSNKDSSQLEGCAAFWSLKRFEIVGPANMHTICLQALLQDNGPIEDDWKSIEGIRRLLDQHKDLGFVAREKTGQVLQIADLRLKDHGVDEPERLLVGNTHLFYHPMADHIRSLQAYFVCHQMENCRRQNSSLPKCPLVICGDLNSNPLSGAVQLLSQGHLEADHPEAWSHLYDYKWEMGDEMYLLEHGYIGNTEDSGIPAYEDESFEDAVESLSQVDNDHDLQVMPPDLVIPDSFPSLAMGYTEIPQFTNYAIDFAETLDYIFVSQPSDQEPIGLSLDRAAPMPDTTLMNEYGAMPNENMPSDHFSIVSDFTWTKFSSSH